MTVEFFPLSEVRQTSIAAFVGDCEDAWIDHHPLAHPLLGDTSLSFAGISSDKIELICVFGIAYYGFIKILAGPGFAFSNNITKNTVGKARDHLLSLAKKAGISAVHWTRPPEAPSVLHGDGSDFIMDEMGFHCDFPWGGSSWPTPARSVLLNLMQSSDSLEKQLSSNHRRALRKSRRKQDVNLTLLAGNCAQEAFLEFRSIHEITFKRTGTQKYSKRAMDCIKNLLANEMAYCANLYEEDKCVAAAVLTTAKGASRYLAGGCSDDALAWGGFVRLHVEAARKLAEAGVTWYNIGPYFPSLRSGKLEKIGEFKRRFGGTQKRYVSGLLIVEPRKFFWKGAVGSELLNVAVSVRTKLRKSVNIDYDN